MDNTSYSAVFHPTRSEDSSPTTTRRTSPTNDLNKITNTLELPSMMMESSSSSDSIDYHHAGNKPLEEDEEIRIELGNVIDDTSSSSPLSSTKGITTSTTTETVVVGGASGHLFRRLWHILSFLILPLVYYLIGNLVLGNRFAWPRRIVSLVCLVYLILETIRLTLGFTCFGMRTYEASRISGNAWVCSPYPWCSYWHLCNGELIRVPLESHLYGR